MPREWAAIAGGWFDAKLFKGLFKANRRAILRDMNAPGLKEEKDGILAAGIQTALDIRAGLRSDRKLKAKFIGLAATEIVLDIVDAKLGLSRNFPGLIASLLVSQVVGLKELDWTAKAVKLGIQARQQGDTSSDLADVPAVRFLDIIGLKRVAQIISLGIHENPDLKSSLDKSDMTIRVGISACTFTAVNYVGKLISSHANENDTIALGVGEVISGSIVAVGLAREGVLLRKAYCRGQKLKAPEQKLISHQPRLQNYP